MTGRLDPRDYTDPHVSTYCYVPPVGRGVCAICHSGPRPGLDICWSCSKTTSQVSWPADLVVPISLYRVADQLWNTLRYYKDGRTPAVRNPLGTRVAATLARFIDAHQTHIENELGSPISMVTAVPSSSGRPGTHPLESAVKRVSAISDLYVPTLTHGGTQLEHLKASDDGYKVTADVSEQCVLLVEDTFTSGARVQSAASALRLAGASSVAALVIGRVIDPDHCEPCHDIWSMRDQFSFDHCCLEPASR